MIIYTLVVYGSLLILCVLIFLSLLQKKGLLVFLHSLFTLIFWFSLVYLVFNVCMQIFTKDGKIVASKNSSFGTTHYTTGYLVPVHINLNLPQKKIYEHKEKDSISGKTSTITFTKYANLNPNYNNIYLEKANLTKNQLDSIFKYSNKVKSIGKKLGIESKSLTDLKITKNQFSLKGNVLLKSKNYFFTASQLIKTYLTFVLVILIFYQLKQLFKMLKKEIIFSLKLYKKINLIAILIICWQVLNFLISVAFSFYYSFIGLVTNNALSDIQINIHPRIEIDVFIILFGLGLLVLSRVLKKANELQQENDLTI